METACEFDGASQTWRGKKGSRFLLEHQVQVICRVIDRQIRIRKEAGGCKEGYEEQE